MTDISLNSYYTLIAASLVLLLGRLLVNNIKFLRDFNIPEPVAGGILVAILFYIAKYTLPYNILFDKALQGAFMLAFFTSIGLSADFSKLKLGGKPLVIFLLGVSAFVVVQNAVGVSLAKLLGLDALMGLMAGSITLVGGHGTAIAWSNTFQKEYGIEGAQVLGVASATFGLVLGGLIGGPVAKHLLKKVKNMPANTGEQIDSKEDVAFEHPNTMRLITSSSGIETLAMFAAAMAFSDIMLKVAQGTTFQLPQFVWALAGGVIVRNGLVYIFKVNMFDRAIDVFGNISLSLFLAMALMSLKLWELAGLAGPILIILAVQTIVMALFAIFITFKIMGSDYDAAILAAGHCGFGMGATPTAVANMQALTDRFGPSHKAFLIVPMVGAFFIDIVNATVIKAFIDFLV